MQRNYGPELPPVFGMFLGAWRAIAINSAEYLEDIYVKLNSMHSKHVNERH